jgi:hypothetical protein
MTTKPEGERREAGGGMERLGLRLPPAACRLAALGGFR